MKFCGRCGGVNEHRIPEGDNRARDVCTACGNVHYVNPRLVVGCIVVEDGKLLLCRRAIEPRRGYWTLPAGFQEMGESSAEGAARETLEEAGATVQILAPYAHLDIPHIGQGYLLFRAVLSEPGTEAGEESLELGWFAPAEIPWDDIAFPAVRVAMELFVEDLAENRFRIHHATVRGHDPVRVRSGQRPAGTHGDTSAQDIVLEGQLSLMTEDALRSTADR